MSQINLQFCHPSSAFSPKAAGKFCNPRPDPIRLPLNGGTQTISFQSIYNGETLTTSRFVFVPPQAESFTYDDDGNLLADGLWNYYYNAADQLVDARPKTRGRFLSLFPLKPTEPNNLNESQTNR